MSVEFQKIKVENSKSIISFDYKGNGTWKIWDRFLLIENKPAYHLGNVCGTCEFFFERLEGANKSFSIDEIRNNLQKGISDLNANLVESFKLILPKGEYFPVLLNIKPYKVSLGEKTDYFANEQVETWGIEGFWNLPHYPKIEYYRSLTKKIGKTGKLFEFVVPMFPENWLNNETVDLYQEQIKNEQKPTAVAISILDVKEPADVDEGNEFYAHWCLSHYLIDGHHKVFAATLLNKPITLLSFLAVKESVANEEQIQRLSEVLELNNE
jgi:hypothetical protein